MNPRPTADELPALTRPVGFQLATLARNPGNDDADTLAAHRILAQFDPAGLAVLAGEQACLTARLHAWWSHRLGLPLEAAETAWTEFAATEQEPSP